MSGDEKILGIVPAREGSRRVPRKNVAPLAGRPLIDHTFDAAIEARRLSRLIVSTNDEAVIRLAEARGVEVPFRRPEAFADDRATDLDWVRHAVTELETTEGWAADYVVILRPTCPFRQPSDIDGAVEKILAERTDSVRSLTRVDHHPYWMKRIEGNLARPFMDLGVPEETLRSQDLPPLYRLNGLVDVLRTANLATGSLYGQTMGFVLIDASRAVDIDTEEDLAYCRYLLERRRREP